MRQFLILAALLLVPFALLAADSTDASLVRTGDRIRFWFWKIDVPDQGILTDIGNDSIVVKNETVRAFRIEDISYLHRSTGKQGHPPGVYIYRLEAGDFSTVRKMVLMK